MLFLLLLLLVALLVLFRFVALGLIGLLRLLLLLLVVGGLLDPGQHGAGEGEVVGGVIMGGVGRQDLLEGHRGAGVITELEAGVTEVVSGILGLASALEGAGSLLEETFPIERDPAPVGIGEAIGRVREVALLESGKGLLLGVLEQPRPSGGDETQAADDPNRCRKPSHDPALRRIRARNWGRSSKSIRSTGIQ